MDRLNHGQLYKRHNRFNIMQLVAIALAHCRGDGYPYQRRRQKHFHRGGGGGTQNKKNKKRYFKPFFGEGVKTEKQHYYKASIYYICTMYENPGWGTAPCPLLPTPIPLTRIRDVIKGLIGF